MTGLISGSKENPDKQENSGRLPDGTFAPGHSGNPAGRPKRKTLTEMLHDRLDAGGDYSWNEVVEVILSMVKGKEKDIVRAFWEHTDGKPNQKTDITSKGEKVEGLVVIKDAS